MEMFVLRSTNNNDNITTQQLLTLDSTLREGEQTPGVNFSRDQKLHIAQTLDEIGIDMIEAGHPSVSPEIANTVRELANAGFDAEILAHVRAVRSDIDLAIDTGVDRIVVFLPTSDLHLSEKLHMDRERSLEIITREIEYITDHGINVRYTPEDATRSDPEFLIRACQIAVAAGADRVSIADTVGVAYPTYFGALVNRVSSSIDAGIDVHCHNDLGFATANAFAALDNGASCVHTTINGLGERCGIVDSMTYHTALRFHRNRQNYDLEQLRELSDYVAEITQLYCASNTPVLGQFAFTHTSGVHTDGVLKNPETYEPYDPSIIGRQRQIHIGRYTGKLAVIQRIQELGLHINEHNLIYAINQIKANGDRGIEITDTVLREIVADVEEQNRSGLRSITGEV